MADQLNGVISSTPSSPVGDDVFSVPNSSAQSQDPHAVPSTTNGIPHPHRLPRRSSIIKDTSLRGLTMRKKTVSFSSMPSEKTISNIQDCLNYMQNGSELTKVRTSGRQYQRIFSIDPDLSEIRWHPTAKKPNKARILVDEIKEVREGKNSDTFRNCETDMYNEECSFSIMFGDNFESLDLVANSPDEAHIWITGLTCLVGSKKSLEVLDCRQEMRDSWLHEVFEEADLKNSGQLDEMEIVNLVKTLSSNINSSKVQQKLKEAGLEKREEDGKRGRLTSEEFIRVFKEMATRPEIYFLLARYSSNTDYMSTDDLLLFLEAEQGLTRVSKSQCLDIIAKFEPSKEGKKRGQLGIDGFTAYLLSEECNIFDSEHKEVYQDMSQTLTHYYIASSHNTYLLEDQLRGPSSVEGYIRAFKKGCKCLELDCWDGNNDDPIIYHGHTLTTKISFKSVIEAINQYAFAASKFPVILSIENHCSLKQQEIMAQYLIDILGNKLYTTQPDDCEFLPSPNDLQGKILIKNKKLPDENEIGEGYVSEEDEGSDSNIDNKKKNNKKDGPMKKLKLAKQLSDLVTLCKSVRFVDFQSSLDKHKPYEMCSFSESIALKLASNSSEEYVNHNKHFLSRIYPNGTRVDSSNYNPQDMWNCGCQLVALNYQTPGLMMDIYIAKFNQNGNCGYVLKPEIMRDEIAYFNATTKDSIPGVTPQILHIKIISGNQFPKPKGSGAKGDYTDPYVSIEVFGIPADCAEQRTRTVQHNGYNPLFDESFEYQINLPELALVRFCVLDDEFIGDSFIAQYTVPFESMRPGYRHIHLRSNTGDPIPNCTLFVHVAITNKRGGGKSQKRGNSIRISKRSKDYTSMKSIGVKNIDETFRVAIQPLRDGADLRDNVQTELAAFKENCGLAPISNIKQCIRLLGSRISACGDAVTLTLTSRAQYPHLEAQGHIPDVLKKALISFENVVGECKSLIKNADAVYERIIHSQQAGLEWHDDLNTYCHHAGLKGKKLNKAMENFAWNIRVLQGQADLLQKAKTECLEYMRQIQEAAVSSGLSKDINNTNGT